MKKNIQLEWIKCFSAWGIAQIMLCESPGRENQEHQ